MEYKEITFALKSKGINVDWKLHCLVLSKIDVLPVLFVSG